MLYDALILLTAFPAGFLLAALTREELAPGKRWFRILLVLLIVLGFIGFFLEWTSEILLTISYLFLITSVSIFFGGRK